MKSVEKIIDCSPQIEILMGQMLEEVRNVLPNSEVEPIGSMAVHISGKEEIDLMVISNDVASDSSKLVAIGYRQGPVEGDISYLKKKVDGIEVDVQVIPSGHEMIETHRRILEKLRDSEDLRKGYEDIKKSLVGSDIKTYRVKKGEWIKENLLNDGI